MRQVAILFARADSVYKTMPGCDTWDIERDARLWPGGAPVVAHPPCRAWGQLRHMANPIPGERHLATWSVRQVRAWGGVLEHPAQSRLWPRAGLPAPGCFDKHGGWTLGIHQNWFGHRAAKATLLYIVGCEPRDIPTMPFILGEAEATCGTSGRRKSLKRKTSRPEISKAEREHTPHQLAEWLVDLARRCHVQGAAQ